MKAILDHVGIAVSDLAAALAFYRDALGLEVEPPEEVRVAARARAFRAGRGLEAASCSKRPRPTRRSRGNRQARPRAPPHHAARGRHPRRDRAAQGARSEADRRAARGQARKARCVAFMHPASAHGVLRRAEAGSARATRALSLSPAHVAQVARLALGDMELDVAVATASSVSTAARCSASCRSLLGAQAPPDERNRVTLAMRPLLVRGARTMIIDAGIGRQGRRRVPRRSTASTARCTLDHALAEAGIAPEEIEIVLATHLHFDHAGGFTRPGFTGASARGFPARSTSCGAANGMRRRPARTESRQLPGGELHAAGRCRRPAAGDEDQTIMPGVRVRRTGGHTMHHQMVLIESGGKTAVFVADMMPTTAHAPTVDHGRRSVSDGHAGREERVRAARPSTARSWCFRARPGGGGRLHPGARRQAFVEPAIGT